MDFKRSQKLYSLGKYVGVISAYFVSSFLLYFVLSFLEKLPLSWSYLNILPYTAALAVVGILVKRWFG